MSLVVCHLTLIRLSQTIFYNNVQHFNHRFLETGSILSAKKGEASTDFLNTISEVSLSLATEYCENSQIGFIKCLKHKKVGRF